ncbi:MAG: PAS domain-containing protein [Cyclobacteriaceae bacterium]|nr:PAS domain-containing protein [Cyclobacteriaceae bacterium]
MIDLEQLKESLVSIVDRLNGFTYRCKADKNYTMIAMAGNTEDLIGYPSEDFIDNKRFAYAEIIAQEDIAQVDKAVDKAILNRTNWNIEYRIHTSSGALRWVNEVGGAVYDEKGELKFLEGMVFDIAKQKKEADFRHQIDRIVQSMVSDNRRVIEELQRLHILALNARIEAARSGSSNSGFAVVANEVQYLAEETGKLAKKISQHIQEFEEIVDKAD